MILKTDVTHTYLHTTSSKTDGYSRKMNIAALPGRILGASEAKYCCWSQIFLLKKESDYLHVIFKIRAASVELLS